MFNHTMPTPLTKLGAPLAPESTARWARAGAQTCIIFVHGYGGQAVTTWGDFSDMATDDPAFANCDLVFMGYESRSRQAAYSAGVLFQAVALLAETPATVIQQVGGPPRDVQFTYDSIVLVGHSLGGVLVRDVAMNSKRLGKSWADKLSLALFAPAHLGALAIELAQTAGIGFSKFFGLFKAAAITGSPVLNDLTANSPYLTGLLAMARQIGIHNTTQARFVVHAAADRIVVQNQFYEDPPAIPYPGHDHISCCKPRRLAFDEPVRHLAGVIR